MRFETIRILVKKKIPIILGTYVYVKAFKKILRPKPMFHWDVPDPAMLTRRVKSTSSFTSSEIPNSSKGVLTRTRFNFS